MKHGPLETVGKRFGKLVVIDLGDQSVVREKMRFLCKCDCGREKVVARYHLRSGAIDNCGCNKREQAAIQRRKRTPIEAAFNEHYTRYQRNARNRNIEFSLTEEEFILCSSGDCLYCGGLPVEFPSRFMAGQPFSGYAANGIDRIDSSVGYVVGNIVPCCGWCNMAKGTKSQSYFIQMCKAVAAHNSR